MSFTDSLFIQFGTSKPANAAQLVADRNAEAQSLGISNAALDRAYQAALDESRKP